MDIKMLGPNAKESDFISRDCCSDGNFVVGTNGVDAVLATADSKVEFIFFKNFILAHVKSALGYPAYYPLRPVKIDKPLNAVLMDLDGTSVRSEDFWIWIIQMTIATLTGNSRFELEQPDLPYVSGHSVSEHLKYCIKKYCPDKTLEEARKHYFEHANREMQEIMQGRGKPNAFKPTAGLKDFLCELKAMNVKIGLVTSGLYEKAWPEIVAAFRSLNMGNPEDFYDAIITAGFPFRKGKVATLGELSPKPHLWLYAEIARVGLGVEPSQNHTVVGIEDSSAGVCAIRLAGFSVIGFDGGNIAGAGVKGLCSHYCRSFVEVLDVIKE